MRKLLIPLIINILLTISNNSFAQTFSGGNGSIGNPYQISNVNDLNTIATYVNNNSNNFSGDYFILTNDISVGNFTPIGKINSTGPNKQRPFSGIFNGQGHIISNFNVSGITYIGLFGYISNATIENIGIGSGCNINSDNSGYTGSLVGYAENSTINSCYSIASLSGNTNCRLGGLIGNSDGCTVSNCYYSNGNINYSGTNGYYGGLIGYIEGSSTISNCYSSPSNFPNQTRTGPLYGRCNNSTIINSYFLNNWASQTEGTPKTLAGMQQMQFAIDLNVSCQNHNWKYDNGNPIINNGLPILYWQVGGSHLPSCFDGNGTENDPFRIRYAKDLITLSSFVSSGTSFLNTFFHVENNIDFHISGQTDSSQYFFPIGDVTNSFQGNINGGGNKISNLTINIAYDYSGLFGYVKDAKFDSLGIEGIFNANYYGGGLIGYASNSKINKCYSISSLSGERIFFNNLYLGGLVGYFENGCEINNCYSRSSLNALRDDFASTYNSYCGGLYAYSDNSIISNSYSAPQSLGTRGTRGVFYVSNQSTSLSNSFHANNISGVTQNNVNSKSPNELKSGCFVVTLNNSQSPIVWFKAKSGVNSGYPVLSWQKLNDNITPAGFEGNCLSVSVNDGHQANPYKVRYVKDLIYISNMVVNDTTYSSKYFQMLNDINYNDGFIDSSSLYYPIGNFSNNKPFSGNFNGLRNAIANYSFADSTKNNIGIFGYTNGATIQRLGISNINIYAKDTVGGLVANVNNTKIGGCFVYGFIKGENNVGGLVGYGNGTIASSTKIDTSFSSTTIDAISNVGGLAGKYNGTISNSYSNSEIYSSTNDNSNVGGIIGYASHSNSLDSLYNVYNACKITRRGSNPNFGKITGNNNNFVITSNIFSRDSVFINCSNPSGKNGTPLQNSFLKGASFVTTLGSTYWKADYSDRINDGYPILKYQLAPAKLTTSGSWQTASNWGGAIPKASQVVIIPSGKQLKIDPASYPISPYIIIEKGGELYNNTDINLFGEQRRELMLGKWNFIGLTTNNQTMSFLYNYADTAYKTFVKQFDPSINNWATTTIQNNNTQLNYNTGFLVMPNYSLDAQQLTTSKIASKGVFYNTNTSSKTFTNYATKLVPLANSYNANLSINQFITSNPSKIQGGIVYALNANSRDWNNNLNSTTLITKINPSEGFFVFATNANSSFNFSRTQLISSAKKIAFKELIYVKAKTNDIIREAFIEYNEDSENGFDVEDGLMLFGTNEDIVEPYFKKEDNEILKDAFSSLPYSTELNLRSYSSNNINLEFSNIPKDIKVYLIDSLLRKVQELNSNPLYNLDISEGNNDKRLKILFTNNAKDIENYFNSDELDNIQIWNSNSIININGIGLNRFEVYDIMGEKILQQVITSDEFQTNLNLKSGIYIIKAYSKTSINSSKISICR